MSRWQRRVYWLVPVALAVAGAAGWAAQRAQPQERGERRWAQYEREMQDPIPDPPDAWDEAEFVTGRLRFRSPLDGGRRFGGFRGFGRFGGGRRRWGIDANKGDRVFAQILRRLTRTDVRSVEQIVDIDSDDMYDYPWMLAISIGDWELNDSEVRHMRDYLDRGGFLMVDDFHGEAEWENFAQGIARIVPNSTIVELKTDHQIFHTVYDLNDLYQVSGRQIERGMPYERGGIIPHWRGVVDEKGRIQVAICFNMDVGDSWEWADDPLYPERLSSLGLRMGVNYAMYAMTH
jgi:Domain of unknown function (DUF4159)